MWISNDPAALDEQSCLVEFELDKEKNSTKNKFGQTLVFSLVKAETLLRYRSHLHDFLDEQKYKMYICVHVYFQKSSQRSSIQRRTRFNGNIQEILKPSRVGEEVKFNCCEHFSEKPLSPLHYPSLPYSISIVRRP